MWATPPATVPAACRRRQSVRSVGSGVRGSGSANAAVVGSFTIPLMMRYGVPGTFAGAVETAASMGGLIMPPVMAVAGFVMAEFLGVPPLAAGTSFLAEVWAT